MATTNMAIGTMFPNAQITVPPHCIPDELGIFILNNFSLKELVEVRKVCRKWNELANEDRLLCMLYERVYKYPVPEGKSGKAAFLYQRELAIIDSPEKLNKAVVGFLCKLKLDKKRRFECSFPKEVNNIFYIIQQCFGPNRGSEIDFNSSIDETEKYVCKFTLGEEFILTEDVSSSISKVADVIPIYRIAWSNIVTLSANRFILDTFSTVGQEVGITGIDLGEGNSLAYITDLNGWTEPFKFHNVPATNESPQKWVGRLPFNSEFKMVIEDSKGNITKEVRETNRKLTGYTEDIFKNDSIKFSN